MLTAHGSEILLPRGFFRGVSHDEISDYVYRTRSPSDRWLFRWRVIRQGRGQCPDQRRGRRTHERRRHAEASHRFCEEAAAKTEIASLPEGQEVTVSGKLGCGHCNYHVGTTCSAALQTADGGIYVLDVAEDSEWFQDRYDGLDLKVTGKVHHEGTLVKLEDPNITKL